MRISDWSSDVCSSDLPLLMAVALGLAAAQVGNAGERAGGDRRRQRGGEDEAGGEAAHEVAESGGGGDIAAHHPESLAERALDHREAIHLPLALGDAAAVRPVTANGVHLAEDGHAAALRGELANLGVRR